MASTNSLAPAEEPDEDRSRKIIAVAHDLLDEEGLEGLTIRAVLTRSGLARRAFYEQFQGKDDLVLAVFESTLHAAAKQFRDLAGQVNEPARALEIIVTSIVVGQLGYTGGGLRSAALAREHMRLAQSRPTDLQSALQPLLDLIAGHIARGIELGQFQNADPQLQARLIYNLVSTTVHTVLLQEEGTQPDRAGREKLSRAVWSFCAKAIAA